MNVFWVAGYQGNRKRNRKQTGGWTRVKGGGGGKGLSPCFLISNREQIFETLSSNGLFEEQKNPTLPVPFPIQILLVFHCFLNQALDSDIRGVAKIRSRETARAWSGKRGGWREKSPLTACPHPRSDEKTKIESQHIYSVRLQLNLSSWRPLCGTISCLVIILSLTMYFSLYSVFYRLKQQPKQRWRRQST